MLLPAAQAGAVESDGELGSGPAPRLVSDTSPISPRFADVGQKWDWASKAIKYVAETHSWMDDFGDNFAPKMIESRKLFARAVVAAFAPDEEPDPGISFPDLAGDSPYFEDANVAVKLGWMTTTPDGRFEPEAPMTLVTTYRALVKSLPLDAEEAALADLHTSDGYYFETPASFPTTELGMRLYLRYNHPNEGKDVEPKQPLPRAEVAYALWRTATLDSWEVDGMAPFQTIELPPPSTKMRKVVEWGTEYVGYPYIWGGEWHKKTKAGYCCGGQPGGGFDCSGLMWWLMKRPAGGYNNARMRDYNGWSLPQRTSATMATGNHVGWGETRPGDLFFYDGDGHGGIDHVDLYIGNGWALDSSSGAGGVSILRVSSGWYRDHFARARHLA